MSKMSKLDRNFMLRCKEHLHGGTRWLMLEQDLEIDYRKESVDFLIVTHGAKRVAIGEES